ncbi:MAG: DNA-formamidopyrimidine glycosylase family protein [Chthoniobacteraceae bacterium]
MPELAEVEYFRTRWNVGMRQRVSQVLLHGDKRLFRGSDPAEIERTLRGAMLLGSETRGKQIAFRFSKGGWLGVHLGMSGGLRVEPADFSPGKHDHLVLMQKRQALVFSDPRMFGRVRFDCGKDAPVWWSALPCAVTSPEFTLTILRAILVRRARAPLKALLLMQEFFPGIGNWMADEILWQARLHPRAASGSLKTTEQRALWRTLRKVCRKAMKTIGVDWSDPPDDWLIHQRWTKTGVCPRHGTALERATIGGRTTSWCPRCQSAPKVPR